MRSLRAVLVLGTTLATAGVLAGSGCVLYLLARIDLKKQFDQSLIDSARLLASTMEQGPKKLDGDFQKYDMREFEAPERPGYLEVWLPDGSVFFRSPSLGEVDLERVAGLIDAPAYRWVRLPDGRQGRSVEILFTPRAEKKKKEVDAPPAPNRPVRTVTLVLARGTELMDSAAARLAVLFAAAGLAIIAASAGILWLVVWRGLRPLRVLATHISRLGEHGLSARLDERDTPQELQPVTSRLNEFLDRLEAAFERERTLSADVAHELRTPLAGLRSSIDVVLSRPRLPRQYENALQECLKITVQMQDLVQNLLSLARLEAGLVEGKPEPVSPNQLLRDAWKSFEGDAEERQLRSHWVLEAQDHIVTDPSLLEMIIRNVLGNAVAHANGGGIIKIETRRRNGEAEIRVTNSGSTVPEDEVHRVFDRFWKGDSARTSAGSHCGLGLALVKRIVTFLGGSVAAQSRVGEEFEIVVSIPAHDATLE